MTLAADRLWSAEQQGWLRALGLTVFLPADWPTEAGAPSRAATEAVPERPERAVPELCEHVPIYAGGPVMTDRGFVLHPASMSFDATVELQEGLALSTSLDALGSIADGNGPRRSLICLGYAGWEAGQLEAELADNAWLTCPYSAHILFNTSSELRLDAAAKHLGVNLNLLSTQAGHA